MHVLCMAVAALAHLRNLPWPSLPCTPLTHPHDPLCTPLTHFAPPSPTLHPLTHFAWFLLTSAMLEVNVRSSN